MDGDRKYRQHGYQDSNNGFTPQRSDRSKPQGPKLPIDVTGPKLPRLVQNIVAARCFNCSITLPRDTDFKGACPKCSSALHCCKQCVNFDSSTLFQCLKAIPVRIPVKDQANDCELFSPRFTVARDALPTGPVSKIAQTGIIPATRNANNARAAFDNLFKK
ncbi:MAG: hypothetical protein M3Y24_06765 [Acidobacteriota bacterium]|nr:hypothetical protein [Acidobacteriota bacterium]